MPPQETCFSARARVRNSLGLHARPAAVLVRQASRFSSDIYLSDGDDTVSARSILGILTLGATQGTLLEIAAEGRDAREAVLTLQALIAAGFGED